MSSVVQGKKLVSSSAELERSLYAVSYAIVVGIATIYLVQTFRTKPEQIYPIPYANLILQGGSPSAAGCRCDRVVPLAISEFSSLNDSAAEDYCKTYLHAQINSKPGGASYSKLAPTPCITSVYQVVTNLADNVTLPTNALLSEPELRSILNQAAQGQGFVNWNIETDVLPIQFEMLRQLVNGSALTGLDMVKAKAIFDSAYNGWVNDLDTQNDIWSVIRRFWVISYARYIAACKPTACTEHRPPNDFFSWLAPLGLALVVPRIVLTMLTTACIPYIMSVHRDRRRARVNARLIETNGAVDKKWAGLSEADYEWTRYDRDWLFDEISQWRLEQIATFGDKVGRSKRLTASALADLEARFGQADFSDATASNLSSPKRAISRPISSRPAVTPHPGAPSAAIAAAGNASDHQQIAIDVGGQIVFPGDVRIMSDRNNRTSAAPQQQQQPQPAVVVQMSSFGGRAALGDRKD
jgi:hypothetical protein